MSTPTWRRVPARVKGWRPTYHLLNQAGERAGLRIEHCGPVRANWPYSIIIERGKRIEFVHMPNGRGWRTLIEAQAHAMTLAHKEGRI